MYCKRFSFRNSHFDCANEPLKTTNNSTDEIESENVDNSLVLVTIKQKITSIWQQR